MSISFRRLLILASVLYFLLAPITYHPDTKLNLAYPSLGGGVWNIYSYLESHNLNVPPLHYPPLHYLALKLELPITQLIGGSGYTNWLLSDSTQATLDPQILRYNLASKFPLLLLALLSGWLIYKLILRETEEEKSALLGAAFWFFNPITLYAIVAMGQNDIIAISIFLIGLWYFMKRPYLAFLIFGLSGSIKSYPLIWSGVAAMAFPSKSLVKKLALLALAFAVYGVTLAPFISSSYFRQQVLTSGLVTRFFDSGISIGFNESVLLVPLFIIAVAVLSIGSSISGGVLTASLFVLATNFFVLGFSHFNPQWLLWLVPFWAILFPFFEKEDKTRLLNRFLLLLTFISFLIIVILFEDKFLTWGIFSPLSANLLNLPSIVDFLSARGMDTSLYNNIAHSILAGVGVAFTLWVVSSNKFGKEAAKISGFIDRLLTVRVGWLAKVFMALVVPITFYFVAFWVSARLPIIAMSENSTGNYIFLPTKNIVPLSEFVPIKDNYLYRLEVLFKNPNLESKDRLRLTVSDQSGRQLVSEEVSGFNVGDPSYFRVDFPTLADSGGKSLKITLTNEEVVDGNLAVGFVGSKEGKSLAVRQYAKPPSNNFAFSAGITRLTSAVEQEPIILIVPVVALLLI